MFLTHLSAEIPIRALLGREGPQHWNSVEISGACPLFFVEWSEGFGDDTRSRRCLIGSLEEFERVVKEVALRGRIRSTQLLTPPYVNKSTDWLMEPLIEVSEGSAEDDDYLCGIYRVLNGDVYLESPETGLSELTKRRLIYQEKGGD